MKTITITTNENLRYQKLNNIVLNENECYIEIDSKKHGIKKAFIDAEDIERVSNYTWSFMINTSNEELAFTNWRNPTTGKSEIFYLHRFIINAFPSCEVDHINNNGLDNRKSNLRTSSDSHVAKLMNTQNRIFNGKIPNISKSKDGFKVKDLHQPFKFLMNAFIALEKNRSERLTGYIPLPLWRIEELCNISSPSY